MTASLLTRAGQRGPAGQGAARDLVAAGRDRALLWSANPGLGTLVTAARVLPAVTKVPRVGWVVTDPTLIRRMLLDHRNTSLLGEGGVGHLWAQVLGDWVYDAFDGAGHHDLRTRARDLFTEARATELVARVADPYLATVTARLRDGGPVDVADAGRVLVGRIVADLLGLDLRPFREQAATTGRDHDGNGCYRTIFGRGEELAGLALGTAADTTLDQETVRQAREIVTELTAGVPRAFAEASSDTLLGRARELGLTEREASGLAALLLVAGTETAASAMARTTALLADTGQVHRLAASTGQERDRLLTAAVREGLRVTTPAPVIGRHVTGPLTLGRRRLQAGDRVMALTYPANNRPGRFDLDREYLPENRQLWFGAGRHLCLGAPVARAEVRHLLQALLAAGPWRVTRRRAARRVLIPTYRELVVQSLR